MEDVLDVYRRAYDEKRPQICFDEIHKSLRSTPRGGLPAAPGRDARHDYEYQRAGKCALYLALEPLTGKRYTWVTERRGYLECAEVLRALSDDLYPEAEKIVLVCDNLNTHSDACLYERFPPEEARRLAKRFEWHYTPVHASWLNVAECELSVLKRQCLNRRMSDIDFVRSEAKAWEKQRNEAAVAVTWRFTAEDARIKLRRLYPILSMQQSS